MLAVPIKTCVASSSEILPKLKTSLLVEQGANDSDSQMMVSRDALEGQLNEFIAIRQVSIFIFILNFEY
jgi:hypothetical protein